MLQTREAPDQPAIRLNPTFLQELKLPLPTLSRSVRIAKPVETPSEAVGRWLAYAQAARHTGSLPRRLR